MGGGWLKCDLSDPGCLTPMGLCCSSGEALVPWGGAVPLGERVVEKGLAYLEIAWSVAMFFNVARNEVDGKNYGEAS